jgi:hypothetical protein
LSKSSCRSPITLAADSRRQSSLKWRKIEAPVQRVTIYDRKPASGKKQDSSDDIIIFEVMTADLDRAWWSSYRARLEQAFEQDEILIRATRIEKL